MKFFRRGFIPGLLLAAFLALTVFKCNKHESGGVSSLANMDKSAPAPKAGGARSDEAAAASRNLPATERKQIVSVNMTIEVDDVKKRGKQAEAIAKEFNGYIFQSNISQRKGLENAQITIMIPANNLENAVAKIEKLGSMETQSQNTEDVTRQFIDLSARLNNYKKEEIALAELLNRPGKIEEILKVENELSRVRSEIERIQGELNYLEKQTSYSKIFLNLKAQAAPAGFKNWPISHTVKRAATAFLYAGRALVSLFIYFIFFLPFIVLVYLLGKTLRWWFNRNKHPKPGH